MSNFVHKLLLCGDHVCPWWLAYSFDNPLRRLLHPPEKLFDGLVRAGQTAVDVGCGMGHFTLGLARIVGPDGEVIAVDLQPQMLARVERRAVRKGLADRIRLHLASATSLALPIAADFVVASWMVHEVSDRAAFLGEVARLMKPGAHFFVAEPRVHVSAKDMERTVALAQKIGLSIESRPRMALSRAIVFAKPA